LEILACAHCGAALTRPLTRVRYPPYAHWSIGNGTQLPALMDAGSYAVAPEPSSGPWRRWEDLAEGEAEARGYHAPVEGLLTGPVGRMLCAPADATGTVLAPERVVGFCCGISGDNLSCAACLRPVGGRDDDCEIWQAVWFDPGAVRAVPAGPDRPPADWTELVHDRSGPPPVDARGHWNRRCEQEAAMTLVDLMVATGGAPPVFEQRAVERFFGRELDVYLRTAGPAVRCALHGPGLPLTDPPPGIALVPRHPRTGEVWPAPPGVRAVPVDIEIWRHLAFAGDRRPLRVEGRLQAALERDDPLPPYSWRPVFYCGRLIRDTLARNPAVRDPAFRERLTPWARSRW